MRALLCLTLFAGFVWAGDLSKIERTIAVAPKYSAEQQFYALLVLGTDMSKKIWFVVDDDTLYVDKNGNGDLTEDGEKFQAPPKSGLASSLVRDTHSWNHLKLDKRYTDVRVHWGLVNMAYPATNPVMERFMETARRTPHPNLSGIRIKIAGTRWQACNAMFATSAAKAPILHMDGPLTLGVLGILSRRLERGEKLDDVRLTVGTPGFSDTQAGCFSYLLYKEFPKSARPVLEARFPSGKEGEYRPPQRFVMTGKSG
jgi:hypothetical protein